jgi:Flp pilus assembly protein TadD
LLAACGSSSNVDVPAPSYRDVDPDVVRAVEEARVSVAEAPTSAEAWGKLGDRFAAHHYLAEASLCYMRASELEPENPLWSYRLGWTRFMNNAPDAAGPIERALETLGGSYGPAHEAYAQVLVREGREDEALVHFQRAAELDHEGPHSVTGMGVIALRRGDLDAARTHLEEALARDPRHGEAHIALSRVYMELGREDDARRHAELSRSLPQFSDRKDELVNPQLAPAGSTARTDHARTLEQRGDLAGAEENYRIALQSNPHNEVARKRLAMLMVKDGRKEEAIQLLREAEETGTATELTRAYLERISNRKGRRRE